MGFGSYDESEQQNQEISTDDDTEGVAVHENDHDGKMRFESGGSTSDLLDQLETIKNDDADEE